MKQDCTVSQSTADEIKSFQATEGKGFSKGTHVSEPDEMTGSAIKKCSQVSKETETEKKKTNPFPKWFQVMTIKITARLGVIFLYTTKK